MKYLLILNLLILSLAINAQITDGLYQSSNDSDVANYYLSIKGEEVIFFGWDVTMIEKDTVYFRSTTEFDINGNLKFNDFEFQNERITINNWLNFKAMANLEISTSFLYRYLDDIKETDGLITLRATKDIYFSRFDNLEFVKVR